MELFSDSTGLYTDYYEITMAYGYFRKGRQEEQAVFDYFFRTNPFGNGFTVFAGLRDLLDLLHRFTYSDKDLEFLGKQGFPGDFLDYLGRFSFKGTIESVEEGEVVFPGEPLLKISGGLIETQLIESLVLNIINFESLIATKAYRIRQAAGNRLFSEFGLRRAQGWGAMMASRASCIGGADSTSNVMAARNYGMPLSGTLAHSWIQSYPGELEAFRSFAEINGDNTTLLVDTYDTLSSGIPHAIAVAREMEGRGIRLKAIRLDSGDLAYLSKKARKMLDDSGLPYVKIMVSNQLNEEVIRSLLTEQNAPIDGFGVGTELVSGKPDAALDGVYKLSEIAGQPKMKISENVQKITLPGNKKLVRFYDDEGYFFRDGIFLETEMLAGDLTICHPEFPEKLTSLGGLNHEILLRPVYRNGENLIPEKTPGEIYRFLQERIAHLPVEHQRFIRPHLYKVGISAHLLALRNKILHDHGK